MLITPEFLQTKKYRAIRDRLALAHGGAVQAGVWAATDFKVVQRAAGANMSVDVGAGYALINANDPGNLGLYHIQNDATVNVPVIASETNPRIDQVVITVNDSSDGADPSDTPVLQVIKGTAISGVTLDAPGASKNAVPNSSLVIADLLIPANSDATGVITANIRDRRPWARGAYRRIMRTAGSYTTAVTANNPIDSVNLGPRIECSGMPIRLLLRGQHSGAPTTMRYRFRQDNVDIDGGTQADTNISGGSVYIVDHEWVTVPTPGSHIFTAEWSLATGTGTATLSATAGAPLIMIVEELIRQSADNT